MNLKYFALIIFPGLIFLHQFSNYVWAFEMKLNNELIEAIKKIKKPEISLGYAGISFFNTENLESAQLGYSVGINGENLAGTAPGDWKKEWVVIATDEVAGDPIFVDSRDPRLPVYTAMHGAGEWVPELIATSFSNFRNALTNISNIAVGRENPVALENNPIPEKIQTEILSTILKENPGINSYYWKSWFEFE